jgi:hypothetical protein
MVHVQICNVLLAVLDAEPLAICLVLPANIKGPMNTATWDWLVVGCALTSSCTSLAVPGVTGAWRLWRRRSDHGRGLRKETYATLVGMATQASERFLSAGLRQKLYVQRPEHAEVSAHVDEDLRAGWLALETLRDTVHTNHLICSDKIIAIVRDADKYFRSSESLFWIGGHMAVDIDDLHARLQKLIAKLKKRCRREVGLH